MNALRPVLVLLALAAPATPGAAVIPEPKVSYTGHVTVFKNGAEVMSMKVYQTKSKLRMDFMVDRHKVAAIADRGSGVGYFLNFHRKEYMKGRLDGPMAYRISFDRKGAGIRRVGRERVNGHDATKFRIRSRTSAGDYFDGFVWRTKHDLVLRMTGKWRRKGKTFDYVMNLTNVRIGRQSPRLFTVPAGYRRVKK